MEFKSIYHELSKEDYNNYYDEYDYISERKTDLNTKSIDFIFKNIEKNKKIKIVEIGCGSGYLLKKIALSGFNIIGCDIVDPGLKKQGFNFVRGDIENLPFKDNEFDIVICNHTLEHIINVQKAVDEIKRIAKSKIIITVPCQKYYRYTFDLHVHFFPQDSYLKNLMGIDNNECYKLGGDWSYIGYL
jgi:ubiquinone/menaquinone biosynthesis C-methylase UbiE